jgi:pyruvate dehydrogenase E2 component (dihydrolipoamide acetyltransferase)
MPITITIPRLGWNMEDGIFAGWLKQEGEFIRPGDGLFRIEWEKATQDIESLDQGTLRIPPSGPQVGDRVAVGSVIGYLLGPGEIEPAEIGSQSPSTPSRSAPRPPVAPATNSASSTHPGLSDRDEPRISPLARHLASELGIDWSSLRGTGSTGRIRKADVLAAAQARHASSQLEETAPPPGTETDVGRFTPVSSARVTIAARMLESWHTTVPVTLTTSADATNLVNLRAQFKAASRQAHDIPSYTDFLVKLAALVLREHPMLNARWRDNHIEINEHVHIGIAVDTVAGLRVPVIRDASTLSLGQITACSRDVVRRAQEGRLSAGEMQGGTFTISNLGAFGIETFTPVINPPECAILGVGRIQRQPVARRDKITARLKISLSLTFDHRIVDGAPAARFLQSLVQLVVNPGPHLIA